jgi:hypothetical protein
LEQFPDHDTLSSARERYFHDHGLGPDGGYQARWVKFRIGPVVIPFPNFPARVAALPPHDLHHIATGYDTSWKGEAQIAAWELGAGCGRYLAAWVLNLISFNIGLIIAPTRTWRAYLRGRYAQALYNEPWDPAWLDRTVGNLRDRLGLHRESRPVRSGDLLRFAACALPFLTILTLVAIVLAG